MSLDQSDGHPAEFHGINDAAIGCNAAIGVFAETRSELLRWLFSGVVVLMAYTSAAMAFIHWYEFDEPDDPASALVIDLAPMLVAPANVQSDVPPEPERDEAAPEKPVEQVEEEIVPDVTPEIVIPQEKEPEPEPTPREETPPPPAPEAPKVPEAPVAAAPSQGRLSTSPSNAVPVWKRQVVNLLERNKRYPAAARQRSERGTAQLTFSLDRQGRVTASRIVRSSGSAALDQETLELVRRVQPFPAPPPEMEGKELTVPIRFTIQ